MKAIQSVLSNMNIGEGRTFGHLTVFPLNTNQARARDYITLDEALEAKGIEISEISEGGSVPDLLLRNHLDRDVLLIDGEELVGAKQNRVLNVTVLAAANRDTKIPVSCVEAGRWGYRGRRFATSGYAHFAEGRASKMASVSENMAFRRSKQSDQSEVWDSISHKFARMDSHSSTGAMNDIYEDNRHRVEDYVAAFKPEPGQTGAAFAIDGKIKGFEVFEDPGVFQELLPKLVRSYALDAVEIGGDDSPAVENAPLKEFIDKAGKAETDVHPGVGKGEDVRISGRQLTAGALVYDERLLHLAAFRMDR